MSQIYVWRGQPVAVFSTEIKQTVDGLTLNCRRTVCPGGIFWRGWWL